MKKIVHMSSEDKKFIFNYAANKLKMHPAIIEKDFWICYILEYLFNYSKYKNFFTFKGGTSLSKSYSVIKRMSEDIDLILDWESLGIPKNEPYENRSKRQQEIYNAKLRELTGRFLENELYNDLLVGLKDIENLKIVVLPSDQIINIYYPMEYSSVNIGILPCVRLEIGSLAAWTPATYREVSPYIRETMENYNISSITIRTSSISRSFYEKITILHREVNRSINKKMPTRYARHYYDVYNIYNSKYFSEILLNIDLLKQVTLFKMKFYADNWANYQDILNNQIRLVPPEYRMKELNIDYSLMKEMIIGDCPSIEDIINSLKSLEEELNKLLQGK